jgi:hypothetical protein
MNWSSVVRVCSDKCLDCLEQLDTGEFHREVFGMLWFLRLLRRYIDLFVDPSLTPMERVYGAWYVITTLRCWRLWVRMTPGLTVGKNCIPLECFKDTVVSCSSLILTIMAVGDMTASKRVCPSTQGSNE